MNKKDLWLRLKAYHFNHLVPPHLWIKVTAAFGGEDASTKAFADKIARKLQWKHRFALRAIREYKKFIYLGAVSDFVPTPLSPSLNEELFGQWPPKETLHTN